MGKMREIPTRPALKKSRPAAAAKKIKLTPDQQARLDTFQSLVKRQEDEWNAMTPEQQAEATAKWELVKQSINNERAGYRQVFVDD